MGKSKQPHPPSTAPGDRLVIHLRSPRVRAWLASEADKAQRVLADGPGGRGWTHNEVLRAEAEEHAEALRALIEALAD